MKITSPLGAIPLPNNELLNGPFAPRVYMCQKAKLPPKIDGDIFKPFWDAAQPLQPLVDIEGSIRPLPAKETMIKMLWDDENLYIGAVLYGEEIFSYVEGRDEVVFQDNDFEFFLDREGSTHNYIELETNALNTIWDLLLPKPYLSGGVPLDGFNYNGLVSAVKIEGELNKPNPKNTYWSTEIMIPWKGIAKHGSASEAPRVGEYHRFNFSRVQWLADVVDGQYQRRINPETGRPFPEANWVYAPTGVVNIHYPELWAFLVYADENTPDFTIPEYEQIKWELRKEYYAQRAFFEKNGVYSKTILTKSPYHMTIETTPALFQAYVDKDGLRVNIAQDSYTWLEQI